MLHENGDRIGDNEMHTSEAETEDPWHGEVVYDHSATRSDQVDGLLSDSDSNVATSPKLVVVYDVEYRAPE